MSTPIDQLLKPAIEKIDAGIKEFQKAAVKRVASSIWLKEHTSHLVDLSLEMDKLLGRLLHLKRDTD